MSTYIKLSTLEYPRHIGDIAIDPTSEADYALVFFGRSYTKQALYDLNGYIDDMRITKGVVASDTTGVGTARYQLAAAGYSTSA